MGFNILETAAGKIVSLPCMEDIMALPGFGGVHQVRAPGYTSEAMRILKFWGIRAKRKIEADITGRYFEYATNVPYPRVTFTAQEPDVPAVIRTDSKEYAESYEAQCMMGEIDVQSSWGIYLRQVDNLATWWKFTVQPMRAI